MIFLLLKKQNSYFKTQPIMKKHFLPLLIMFICCCCVNNSLQAQFSVTICPGESFPVPEPPHPADPGPMFEPSGPVGPDGVPPTPIQNHNCSSFSITGDNADFWEFDANGGITVYPTTTTTFTFQNVWQDGSFGCAPGPEWLVEVIVDEECGETPEVGFTTTICQGESFFVPQPPHPADPGIVVIDDVGVVPCSEFSVVGDNEEYWALTDDGGVEVFPQVTTIFTFQNVWTNSLPGYECENGDAFLFEIIVEDCPTPIEEEEETETSGGSGPGVPGPEGPIGEDGSTLTGDVFTDYPFLNNLVDVNDCEGVQISVYEQGSTDFILVNTNEGINMYNSNGLFYCADAPGFSCTAAYGLGSTSNVWLCGDDTTEPPTANFNLTVCLGETIENSFNMLGVPIDGCQGQPQGPLGTVSASPSEGVSFANINNFTADVTFSPTVSTFYTITHDGFYCGSPASVSATYYVEVIENCDPVDLTCGVENPLNLPWLQAVINSDTGPFTDCTDALVKQFTYEGETYFAVTPYLISVEPGTPACSWDDATTVYDCEGNQFCQFGFAPMPFCDQAVIDAALAGTEIYGPNVGGGGETPEIFNTFPWLNSIVNPNNCEGTTISVYTSGAFSFVFVQTPSGGSLYFEDGSFYCSDASGFSCVSAYGFGAPTTVWTCGGNLACPEIYDPVCGVDGNTYSSACHAGLAGVEVASLGECTTEPNPEVFNTFPWLNSIVNPNNCEGTTISVYTSGAFSFVFVQTPSGGSLYFEDGSFYCSDAPGFSCVTAYGFGAPTTTWTCGGNLACPDIYDPVCGVDGVTYGNECLAEQAGVAVAFIGECTTEPNPPIFTDFPWLNSIVNPNDCEGTVVYVYTEGIFSFVFVETSEGGTLYFEDGSFYCSDAPGFSCVNAYGFDAPSATWICENELNCTQVYDPVCGVDGNTYSNACHADLAGVEVAYLGECSTEPNPEVFNTFPWLNSIVNPNNCEGTTISVYTEGTFSFVFVETPSGGSLYFQDGSFYCSDAPGFSCVTAYGFGAPTTTWTCGTNPPPSDLICGVENPVTELTWVQDYLDTQIGTVGIGYYEHNGGQYIAFTPYAIADVGTTVFNCDGTGFCYFGVFSPNPSNCPDFISEANLIGEDEYTVSPPPAGLENAVNARFVPTNNPCENGEYCVKVQLNGNTNADFIGTSTIRISYDPSVVSFNGNSTSGMTAGSYTSINFDADQASLHPDCTNLGFSPYNSHGFDGLVPGDILITVSLISASIAGNIFACPGIENTWTDVSEICFEVLNENGNPNFDFTGVENGDSSGDPSGTNFNTDTNDTKYLNGAFTGFTTSYTDLCGEGPGPNDLVYCPSEEPLLLPAPANSPDNCSNFLTGIITVAPFVNVTIDGEQIFVAPTVTTTYTVSRVYAQGPTPCAATSYDITVYVEEDCGLDKPAPLCTEALMALVVCHEYGSNYRLEELDLAAEAGSVQQLDETCFRYMPGLTTQGNKEISAMVCNDEGVCEMVLFEVKVGNCNETNGLLTQGENMEAISVEDLDTKPSLFGDNESRLDNDNVILDVFTMYPNPTKDRATLQINESSDYEKTITVYDLKGTAIQQIEIPALSNQSSVNIKLSEMPTGVYMVQLRTPFTSEVKRLIKE